MPEKIVQINSLSVSISVVMGLIFALASSYIAVVLKNINLNIDVVKEKLLELKVTQKENLVDTKKDLEESFNRIRDLENIQNIIKSEHDRNHRGKNG